MANICLVEVGKKVSYLTGQRCAAAACIVQYRQPLFVALQYSLIMYGTHFIFIFLIGVHEGFAVHSWYVYDGF